MESQYRRCARCGTTKAIGFFPHARANNCLPCAEAAKVRHRERTAEYLVKRNAEQREQRAALRALRPPKPPYVPPPEKSCTKCGETKPLADFGKNAELRDGRNSWCRACVTAGTKQWRDTPEGREKWREAKRRHRAKMTPEQVEKERARLNAASERAAERKRQATAHAKALALAQRLDVLLFDHRAHVDAWLARPPPKPWWDVDDADLASDPRPNRVKKLRRIRTINRATPPWADKREIAAAYRAAQLLTEQTGNLWHVDHVIPLRHPLVCGLHCEANLQLLPSGYNEAKGNQWSPDHA